MPMLGTCASGNGRYCSAPSRIALRCSSWLPCSRLSSVPNSADNAGRAPRWGRGARGKEGVPAWGKGCPRICQTDIRQFREGLPCQEFVEACPPMGPRLDDHAETGFSRAVGAAFQPRRGRFTPGATRRPVMLPCHGRNTGRGTRSGYAVDDLSRAGCWPGPTLTKRRS